MAAPMAPADTTTVDWASRLADLLDPPAEEGKWEPWPKQRMATDLAHQADELLFGGAAGPGKTEWLMRIAIDEMEAFPGNRGVLFRRVLPSAERTIIPRLQAILANGRAKYNANQHTFTFPNGSVLEISSLQYSTTIYDFSGAEYGFMGFEELTEFLLSQYEYMITRLRAPVDGVRPFCVSTTNPGGVGHKWVKRRFVKPDTADLEPGAARPAPTKIWRPKFDPQIHTEEAPPLRRVFVPAVYTDNPALLQRDPGYLSRLRSQSKRGMRKALEFGDWDAIDAVEGALWNAEWLDLGRIDPVVYRKVVPIIRRVVAVDPSDGEEGGDAYGVAVCTRGADGVGYTEESYEWKNLSPKMLALMTLRLAARVRADAIVIEKNHGGKWLLEVFRMVDPYANIEVVWASDNKITRAEPVAVLFEFDARSDPMVRGRIVGYQEALEDELTMTSFSSGEPSPNMLDAMVWGFHSLMIGGTVKRNAGPVEDQRLEGRR